MKKKKTKYPITTHQLNRYLANKKIKLDCGHKFQVHELSNTMVVIQAGKRIETLCHS